MNKRGIFLIGIFIIAALTLAGALYHFSGGNKEDSEINEIERRVNENLECIHNFNDPKYLERDECKVLMKCLNDPDCRNRLETAVNEIYTRAEYPTTTLDVMLSGSRSHSPDDTIPDPPKKVNLIGVTVARMTYGRIRVKNLTPNTSFSYFIASPDDVIEEGALRYSPTTRNIGDEPIRIIGKMSDQCFWDEPEYFGCVPWIDIEKIEKLPDSPRF